MPGGQAADGEGRQPVVATYEEIGSRWRLVVLRTLGDAEMRFTELKRATGASARTLSRVLDDLGERDLVERRVEEDTPVATYYRRTERAAALDPVFAAMERWDEEWGQE